MGINNPAERKEESRVQCRGGWRYHSEPSREEGTAWVKCPCCALRAVGTPGPEWGPGWRPLPATPVTSHRRAGRGAGLPQRGPEPGGVPIPRSEPEGGGGCAVSGMSSRSLTHLDAQEPIRTHCLHPGTHSRAGENWEADPPQSMFDGSVAVCLPHLNSGARLLEQDLTGHLSKSQCGWSRQSQALELSPRRSTATFPVWGALVSQSARTGWERDWCVGETQGAPRRRSERPDRRGGTRTGPQRARADSRRRRERG